MESKIEIVKNVVQPMEESRMNTFEELQTEFESSSRWLSLAFESLKRKIVESKIEDKRELKKSKGDRNVEMIENTENIDPNVSLGNNTIKEKIVKDLQQEDDCGQNNVRLDKQSVMSMKVVELRTELLRRGLDATGLKKTLQGRLQRALKTETRSDGKDSNSIEDETILVDKPTEVDGCEKSDKTKICEENIASSTLADYSAVMPTSCDSESNEINLKESENTIDNLNMHPATSEEKISHDEEIVSTVDIMEGRRDSKDDSAIHLTLPDTKIKESQAHMLDMDAVDTKQTSTNVEVDDAVMGECPMGYMKTNENQSHPVKVNALDLKQNSTVAQVDDAVMGEYPIGSGALIDENREEASVNHDNEIMEDNTESSVTGRVSESKIDSITREYGNEFEKNNSERNEPEIYSSDIKMHQKKGFGKKILKATTKFLFSPKKKDNPPASKSPRVTASYLKSNGHFLGSSKISADTKDVKGANEILQSQTDKQSPPSPKPGTMNGSKRASVVYHMSDSEILEKEKTAKPQITMVPLNEEEEREKSQKIIAPSNEKEKTKNLSDEKFSSDAKKSYRVIKQEKKAPGNPRPKVIATPMVSSKNSSAENGRPVLSKSSHKAKALADARKARLAEIRGKVASKTVTLDHVMAKSKIQKKDDVSHSHTLSQTKADGTKMTTNEFRKKTIAAEMRQKAANATKNHTKCLKPTNTCQSKHAYKSHLQQNAKLAFLQKQKVLSPMDTYEISDRDDSDSGESEYEERTSKKKIPKWALKANLIPALEKQFLDGVDKLDPDEIFPEVTTCDLEAIFDKKKNRYIKRTSSGNWTKDSVTQAEKLVYKRKMGFNK